MGKGIRADVRIDSPAECPIAQLSGATGTASYTISRSVAPDTPGTVTEEFVLDAGGSVEPTASLEFAEPNEDIDVDEVFSYGQKRVLRFSRARGRGCPCECVEQFDCPVVDLHARDGALFIAFHAPDMDVLQDAIRSLRDRYPNADVQRLLRSNGDRTDNNLVFVDRSTLTDRQLEVLETAHGMGYYEHPKGANAGEVAAALGISTSTFIEHLAAAQRKLLSAILDA